MLKSIIRTLLQKFIPKGIKQEGFKELSWNKADLDIFLSSKN